MSCILAVSLISDTRNDIFPEHADLGSGEFLSIRVRSLELKTSFGLPLGSFNLLSYQDLLVDGAHHQDIAMFHPLGHPNETTTALAAECTLGSGSRLVLGVRREFGNVAQLITTDQEGVGDESTCPLSASCALTV